MTQEVLTRGMTIGAAQSYLRARTELVFDRKSFPRSPVTWSVQDAHSARLVLFELKRLQQLKGEG